jgi:hypothetical protein
MIFHSSLSAGKDIDKKTLSTFLYGSVLYIIFHALMTSNERPFFITIQNYYWTILAIDIISMLFIYGKLAQKSTNGTLWSTAKAKIRQLLESIIDTSIYTSDVYVEEEPNRDYLVKRKTSSAAMQQRQDTENPDQDSDINSSAKYQLNGNSEGARLGLSDKSVPHGILKKTIAEQDDQQNETDDLTEQDYEQINEQLKTLSTIANNVINPGLQNPGHNTGINMTTKPHEPPAAVLLHNASSIKEIRNKLLATNSNSNGNRGNGGNGGNGNDNEPMLNYDPNAFLASLHDNPGPVVHKGSLELNTNNIKKTQADNQSVISCNSDIGSMLDFDLSEFAMSVS